jgi:hypothetical protein
MPVLNHANTAPSDYRNLFNRRDYLAGQIIETARRAGRYVTKKPPDLEIFTRPARLNGLIRFQQAQLQL